MRTNQTYRDQNEENRKIYSEEFKENEETIPEKSGEKVKGKNDDDDDVVTTRLEEKNN